MGDLRAELLEERPGALERLGLAAGEDREGRLLGALAAARDRGVDIGHAGLREAGGERPGRRRADRRAIDDEAAPGQALAHAGRPEQDRLDVRRIRDADEHDVRCGPSSAGVAASWAPAATRSAGPSGRPVPDRQRIAGPQEVAGHRGPHRPEPHEPDALQPRLHRAGSPLRGGPSAGILGARRWWWVA